jgi:endonuclease/exonuclease/phosphatase family metal-dependent hydrolase
MKIATYNVRNLYDPGTLIDPDAIETVNETFFNQRINYFIEKFKKLNLDIICLQEIGGEKGVSVIGDTLGYDYFFAKPNSRGIRMAVLYKKEFSGKVKCQSVSFGEIPVPNIEVKGDTENIKPITQSRDVLVCDFIYNEKPVRIVTFHLKSLLPMFLEGESFESDSSVYTNARFRSIFFKSMELKAIRVFTEKSLDEGKEIILLGDFNEDRNGSTLSILKDSNDEGKILYEALTTYEGDKTTHVYRGNKLTFDTIIVSPKLKDEIVSVAVLNEDLKQDYSVLPFGEIEHIVEPDHAMVWMELK